jgi:hypothetical protein
MKDQNHCGCCGRPCASEWCDDCDHHVDKRRTFWDATYLAQHGVDCPFQISSEEAIEELGL